MLTFPGLGGASVQISALVPPALAYTPYSLSITSVVASSAQSAQPAGYVIDGNLSNFWVSAGTSAGQGPTTNNPQWLKFSFARLAGVSGFQVYPRTANGGYGPKAMQMLLNGNVVYAGTMAATSALAVNFTPPVYATNAKLLIFSAYDPNFPTNSRNVQVVEVTFAERALPGTFGDWALQHFTDAQLNDPGTGYALADPDADGAPNLLEYAMGGNPFVADATNFLARGFILPGNQLALQFHERIPLGDVQRQFQISADLLNWTNAVPLTLSPRQNLGSSWLYQAAFPAQSIKAYYRIKYSQTN